MGKHQFLLIPVFIFLAAALPSSAQTGGTNGLQPFVDYHTNGQVHLRGTLRNGAKEGLWTEYYPDGKKFRELHFQAGILEGPYAIWFSDGKRSEGSFKNGKTDGLIRLWYPNGQLESENEVVQDKSNGHSAEWYPDGKKRTEGQCREGNRVGHWMEWDEKGAVVADGTYDDRGNPLDGTVRVRDSQTRKYVELKHFKNGVEIKP